jgi:glycosyltransferase involved in cell wall biosynthesis
MTPDAHEAPLFSIVTPVYDPPLDVLGLTIDSVLAQSFTDWELILVDDCSPHAAVRDLLRSYAARDPRIRVIERDTNGHIAAASNDGLAAARGEFIALLDHDDLLTTHALERNARSIAEHADVDYLYSDEDLVDAAGRRHSPFAKPDWSPERLRSQNYCCHFSVLRASLVRDVGGFRQGFDGSQDHDLVLRVTEQARRIVHIPEILYHWRVLPGSAAADPDAKPYALEAGRRAVQEHMDRLGIEATVEIAGPGRYVVKRHFPAVRRVSIIIPTIGSSSVVWGKRRVLVVEAVRSALAHTKHPNLEVVVVYDQPTPPAVLAELRQIAGDQLVLVPFREPFNYSRKINFGVLASSGDRLILLNDDVEVRTDCWVEELLGPLEEPDVGMTGAKLLFSSTAIQHVGLAFLRGEYIHPYRRSPLSTAGKASELFINREVTGVTGACVGLRREVFLEVGGLTEQLPGSFNDVDFSYKIAAAGLRTVLVAGCQLFHFETQTRVARVLPWEARLVRSRWGMPKRDSYSITFPNMPPTPAEKRREKLREKAGRAR